MFPPISPVFSEEWEAVSDKLFSLCYATKTAVTDIKIVNFFFVNCCYYPLAYSDQAEGCLHFHS